jgi:hypothetical protein
MSPDTASLPHFSVHRAFVVQFYADTEVEAGRITGRIEHVVSRRAMTFQSLETLLGFVAQVLQEVQEEASEAT